MYLGLHFRQWWPQRFINIHMRKVITTPISGLSMQCRARLVSWNQEWEDQIGT